LDHMREWAYRGGMAVQSVRDTANARTVSRSDAKEEVLPGFAVAAIREEGRWRCARLEAEALVDLDTAITELRGLRSTGAVLGLLAVDDCFFVLLRPVPGGVSLMLSDAVAALDYDVAADVLDLLRVELPPEEEAVDAPPWPEGDLAILADLGLPADELEVLAGEIELYPDEQLASIGRRCGFGDALAEVVDDR
jgi:putative tRNA adenosine deaminase-associated protein